MRRGGSAGPAGAFSVRLRREPANECRQRLARAQREPDARHPVGTGRADVDHRDLAAVSEHALGEGGDRVDLQARAAADQEVTALELGVRDAECGRKQLPEEDDGGLEVGVAGGTEGHRGAGLELCLCDRLRPAEAARETLDLRQRPVQLERLAAAGRPVQPVDVLGEDAVHEAQPLELGDREMAVVRMCLGHAGEAFRVEAPELLGLSAPHVDVRELLEVPVGPEAAAAAVVGEPALRRDAGPGEDKRTAGGAEELGEEPQPAIGIVGHLRTVPGTEVTIVQEGLTMARRSPGSPRIVSRPLQGEDDWWRLRRLLVELVALVPPGFCWDVRRLDGSRFYHPDPPRNPRWQTLTRLWETAEGRLVAAVNQEGRGDAHLQVHPDFRHLEEEMVAWAEGSLAGPAEEENRRELELVVFDDDEQRRELLERRGYRETSDWRVTRRLCLGHPPPVRSPPAEGYSLRATRPDELQDRERIADLLNVAFGRTFHTAEEYKAFTRTAPSFVADLDLVAVAPDGSFASYVGIAYDGANRRGIVEPVCTHPDHRRNGLARALIREGLTRLEARGGVDATVDTGSGEAANALYAGLELTGTYRASTWRTII